VIPFRGLDCRGLRAGADPPATVMSAPYEHPPRR
jgi:hypothetical protein